MTDHIVETTTQTFYHPQSLGECFVHAGYANYVLQLRSSGLRYWPELGLQPVGGRKDISGLVMCEPGEGNVIAAKSFLRGMESVFEVRLGMGEGVHTDGGRIGIETWFTPAWRRFGRERRGDYYPSDRFC
jgi:hypothetical protein